MYPSQMGCVIPPHVGMSRFGSRLLSVFIGFVWLGVELGRFKVSDVQCSHLAPQAQLAANQNAFEAVGGQSHGAGQGGKGGSGGRGGGGGGGSDSDVSQPDVPPQVAMQVLGSDGV